MEMNSEKIHGNQWAYTVKAKLNDCIDLAATAAETIYYNNCHTLFYMNKNLAASSRSPKL